MRRATLIALLATSLLLALAACGSGAPSDEVVVADVVMIEASVPLAEVQSGTLSSLDISDTLWVKVPDDEQLREALLPEELADAIDIPTEFEYTIEDMPIDAGTGAIIANILIKLDDGPMVEIVLTDDTWTVRDVLD
jgi:hypothetical protein